MPRLALTLAQGAGLRLLLSCTPLPLLLAHRNELTTPHSSWQRLQEGYYLLTKLQLNPYAAGSFHAPPLLLALVGPLTDAAITPKWISFLVWTVADVGIAWAVARIADRRDRGKLLEDEGEKRWTGSRIALLYLLHPFSVATNLARSTVVFSNLFLALALESAISGSLLSAVFLLSFATHLRLHPVLLLPPLVLLANHMQNPSAARRSLKTDALRGAIAFVAHQMILLFASRWFTGSWDFLSSVYGLILTIPDLTPNIGLTWYFFIEMFDHFRSFFLVVFALHPLVYVAPLTYFYRKDALFAIVLLIGSYTLLNSYPTLGDYALWHVLLACYSELLPYVSSTLFHSLLPLYALCLLPTFHHLWLYSGSGNANFFYASTLVWAISQGGWALEFMQARGKRLVGMGLSKEGREKVKEGKWAIVQR
ncbi:GPI-anchor transamidase subunit GAB1 [Sporobolomyces salmoneus]|uniref:GPI-anchor transamidase subunit GAB1 n=1 Tax=Sporobolomyces salmoneus TaxID=183962 RepID=UPI00316DE5AE